MLDAVDIPEHLHAVLVDFKLRQQVERILFQEADLMDSHQYDAWLALWADECHYWVPSSASEADPVQNVAIINDFRKDIENRVWRLRGNFAFSQQPRSRLCRVISNIGINGDHDGQVIVTSRFVLGDLRHERTSVVFGTSEHRLLRDGDQFKIARKKVIVLNNDGVMPNMSYLL